MDAAFRITEIGHIHSEPVMVQLLPDVYIWSSKRTIHRYIFKVYGSAQAQREVLAKAVQALVDDPSVEFDAIDQQTVMRSFLCPSK